ncbi:MAG: hypothetical protein R2710_12405 [Acidimicrobiales bacterium]
MKTSPGQHRCPRPTVSNDEVYSKATVSVNLARGRLTDSEVQTIIAIVTGSVEGLTPENVAVSDTAGNVYAAPGVTGGVGGVAGGSSMDIATEYQNALKRRCRPCSKVSSVRGTRGHGHGGPRLQPEPVRDPAAHAGPRRQRCPGHRERHHLREDYIAQRSARHRTSHRGDNLVDPGDDRRGQRVYYRLREADNAHLYDETVTTRTEARRYADVGLRRGLLDQTVLAEAGLDDAASLTNFENLVGAAVGVQAARGDVVVAVQALPFDTAAAEAEALALEEAASAQGTRA